MDRQVLPHCPQPGSLRSTRGAHAMQTGPGHPAQSPGWDKLPAQSDLEEFLGPVLCLPVRGAPCSILQKLGKPGAVLPKLQMGRLRPRKAAACQDPEATSCPASQDRTPSPPFDLCPRTLLHQLWGPTSQGPLGHRGAASGPRRQDGGRTGTQGGGWWVLAGSQRQDQSRLQALGLRRGPGSSVSWVGGCGVSGSTLGGESRFCT